MELSDTKSQDRFSMTDTVNSEDLNDRIQDIIRQHYGQRELSSSARKGSFPRLTSSNKKKSSLITSSQLNNPDLIIENSNNKERSQNKKNIYSDCQSPSDMKSQKSNTKQNNNNNEKGQLKNNGMNSQIIGQNQSYNNSLMKYSPSTQAQNMERSDFKDNNEIINNYSGYNNYMIENGFSSRKQPFFDASAIDEDQNESDQTIIYSQNNNNNNNIINNNQKLRKSTNGQNTNNTQNSPGLFCKSMNSDVGYYKTFNEEDSQIDIKNLINKLDKKNNNNNNTLNNLTNTSYSFLNGGNSATKIQSNQQGRYSKQQLSQQSQQQLQQDQQIISQFSQQNLSEILPNNLFFNFQQTSNLPYLLKQQKEYESNESIIKINQSTHFIKNLENSANILSDIIKKLTIKQLSAIKMMVKPLEVVQQLTICIVLLVKDGRQILSSYDSIRSIDNQETEINIEEAPWKKLQEYFASPGRLLNELSRIQDIIEMNQVTNKSIDHCKQVIQNISEIQINDNPQLEEQMNILFNYIQSVVSYYDLKQELNRHLFEEQQAIKKEKLENQLKLEQQQLQQQQQQQQQNKVKQQQQLHEHSLKQQQQQNNNQRQKENINIPKAFNKEISTSNFSSKQSKEDKQQQQQQQSSLSRKQSHDRQSNMTFGQSICSDTNRKERNILQPKLSNSSLVLNNNNNNININNINNNSSIIPSQLSTSYVVKTPIKNNSKNNNNNNNLSRNTSSNKPSIQKKITPSSSHKQLLTNSNTNNKSINKQQIIRQNSLSSRENKLNQFSSRSKDNRLNSQSSRDNRLNSQSSRENKLNTQLSNRLDKSERSLSKSSSYKLDRELKHSDLLSESNSVKNINLPKQLDITNTREINKSKEKSMIKNKLSSNLPLKTNNNNSSRNKNNISQNASPNKKLNNIIGLTQNIKNKRSGSLQSNGLDKSNSKQKSQTSLLQQSTQSTRSRYSTQLSDDHNFQYNSRNNNNNSTSNNQRQLSRSSSTRNNNNTSNMISKDRIKGSNNINQQSSPKQKNNCFENNCNSFQSSVQDGRRTSNRQRSLSQNSSRNTSSQKDLKSRNEAAANIKVSRLDKILNLKVKKPDANSCVKNMINHFDEYNERIHSIDNKSSRDSSQIKQKLVIQKQINQEKQEILQIKQKKSKLEFYIERDNKQKIQQNQLYEEQINNQWKLQERERLNGYLEEQKRREKQLIKEMNEESIKCSQLSKQIEDWEDHQFQNNQNQQNYINHLYNESQKQRQKSDKSDMLNYKKLNVEEDRQTKSINSQKSILETSTSYHEEDLKRLNNDLKDQQKRKQDLEDTLERTLDVIYNFRKMTCYKQ